MMSAGELRQLLDEWIEDIRTVDRLGRVVPRRGDRRSFADDQIRRELERRLEREVDQ